jgi:hypothetical protein
MSGGILRPPFLTLAGAEAAAEWLRAQNRSAAANPALESSP